ncbi:hypothetical protein RJZ90_007856 [Blastomyces dermatitidis]
MSGRSPVNQSTNSLRYAQHAGRNVSPNMMNGKNNETFAPKHNPSAPFGTGAPGNYATAGIIKGWAPIATGGLYKSISQQGMAPAASNILDTLSLTRETIHG